MKTDKNGILTLEEMDMLVGGWPACEGGNSEHDRISHKRASKIIAQAQHQADIEAVGKAFENLAIRQTVRKEKMDKQNDTSAREMERNEFDNALRDLALQYAPKQIAKCGNIVTAQWGGWKKPHNVMVTGVAVEVSDIGLTIGQRSRKGITGWLTVQHQYIGRRLKVNGEPTGSPCSGFLLCEFTTEDGQKYERIPSGFNHVGLVFDIERLD